MTTGRVFERERKQLPGGKVGTAHVIRCRECGVAGEMQQNSIKGMNPDMIYKYFRNRGWDVGNRPNGDICPACKERAHKPRLEIVMTTEKTPMNAVANVIPKAEPPREMTREDRRIVYAEIEDRYDVKRSCYTKDWSDQKVATDLGVPRAWVAQLREEFFGPEIDAASAARRADIAEVKAMQINLQSALDTLRKQSEVQLASIQSSLDRLGTKLAKLDNG